MLNQGNVSLREAVSRFGINEKAAHFVFGKIQGKNDYEVLEMLKSSSPKSQFIAAAGLMALALVVDGGSITVWQSLAANILDQQARNYKKYGDKLYPLSEKQLRVIVNLALGFAQAYTEEVSG